MTAPESFLAYALGHGIIMKREVLGDYDLEFLLDAREAEALAAALHKAAVELRAYEALPEPTLTPEEQALSDAVGF